MRLTFLTFKSLRRKAGFSQKTLALCCAKRPATRSRIRQETISQIENGTVRDPRYWTVVALAGALGTEPAVVAQAILNTPAATGERGTHGGRRVR